MTTPHEHVRLRSDYRQPDGSFNHEIVAAERLSSTRFRLLDSPYAVFGCAREDVVEVDSDGIFRVLERGGRVSIQVFAPSNGIRLCDALLEALQDRGGTLDNRNRSGSAFSISVPVSMGHRRVSAIVADVIATFPDARATWCYGNTRPQTGEERRLEWAKDFFES